MPGMVRTITPSCGREQMVALAETAAEVLDVVSKTSSGGRPYALSTSGGCGRRRSWRKRQREGERR
jgi:hypothetical protein